MMDIWTINWCLIIWCEKVCLVIISLKMKECVCGGGGAELN